jgi:hypothetical protein
MNHDAANDAAHQDAASQEATNRHLADPDVVTAESQHGGTATPWWAAFAPVQAEIDCGGAAHRLRWQEGHLSAPDHPDADGELVLAALGGGRPPCLVLAEAWAARAADLDVLTLGPRSPGDRLAVGQELLGELREAGQASLHRVGRRRSGGAGRMLARREQILSVFALGPAFQFRLSATVAAAWSDAAPPGHDPEATRPALVAALTGRLAPAVESWLRPSASDDQASATNVSAAHISAANVGAANVSVTLHEGTGWGSIRSNGSVADHLHARLPLAWLARVWAPGLAVLARHLVVDVLAVSWPRARVLALPEPGGGPRELSIVREGEDWAVGGCEELV